MSIVLLLTMPKHRIFNVKRTNHETWSIQGKFINFKINNKRKKKTKISVSCVINGDRRKQVLASRHFSVAAWQQWLRQINCLSEMWKFSLWKTAKNKIIPLTSKYLFVYSFASAASREHTWKMYRARLISTLWQVCFSQGCLPYSIFDFLET